MPVLVPFSGLMWRFLWDYHQTILRWARWAHAEVRAWPADLSQLDAIGEFARIVGTATSPPASPYATSSDPAAGDG